MRTKLIPFLIVLAMLIPSLAGAEVTNRDMQLMGGIAVSNDNDSFFFAPMEPGLTGRWGLYALSSLQEGPIVQTTDGYPARLLHADSEKVYFLAYSDPNRSVHALYEVDIASKQINSEPLLANIAAAFVERDDSFLYVSTNDPYMLCRYNLKSKSSEDLKSMESSSKKIYDASVYDSKVYFVTRTDSGTEDAYLLNSNGKANNLDKASPDAFSSVLHEGYRVYASDKLLTQIYSMKIGAKKANRIGEKYAPALFSYRFGASMFIYDGDTNRIVALPLDGSSEHSLTMEGESTLSRLIMGGSKDELYFYYGGAIYQTTAELSSQTKLFSFDITFGGTVNLSYIAPLGKDAVLVAGFNQETVSSYNNLMPTNVYVYNRTDGEMLFGYPMTETDVKQVQFGVDPIGDVPQPELEEGETAFLF